MSAAPPRRQLLVPAALILAAVVLYSVDLSGTQRLGGGLHGLVWGVPRPRSVSVSAPLDPSECLADTTRRLQAVVRRNRVFPHAAIPFTMDAVAMANTCLYPPSPRRRDPRDEEVVTVLISDTKEKKEKEEEEADAGGDEGAAGNASTATGDGAAPASSSSSRRRSRRRLSGRPRGLAASPSPSPAVRPASSAASPDPSSPPATPWSPWPGYSAPNYVVEDFCWLMVTGAKTTARARAQRDTWMRHVPPERIWIFADEDFPEVGAQTLPELKGAGGQHDAQHRQARGLVYLYREHPELLEDCKWFMMTDDDVFVNLPALFRMLHGLDWRLPLAIGFQMDRAWWDPHIEKLTFTCGGVLAFSRPSALILAENLYVHPACMVPYQFDVAMGTCLQEFDAIHVHTPVFENNGGTEVLNRDWISRLNLWSHALSLPIMHHITPEQIRELYMHWTEQYHSWDLLEERFPVLDGGAVWG
jgi:hypothetical protein